MSGRIVLAVIGAPHGVRGEMRLKLYADGIEALTRYGRPTTESGLALTLLASRPLKDDMYVVRFREVCDRTAAEALKGATIGVPRSALPAPEDDEFYHADLIGLLAETAEGAALGRIVAVHDHGAGDMIEVKGPGQSRLYPFTRAVVPVVDVPGGRVVVVPPVEIEGEAP